MLFIRSAWRYITRVFSMYIRHPSIPFPINVSLPHNVNSTLYLLLGSGHVYQRQPRPSHRRSLVGRKSLYRPHSLPDNLEHRVELSCYHLFMYLGRRAPEHSVPEEERRKRLDWKMYMESIIVICRAPSSVVRLCVTCARVRASMGDQTILERSEIGQCE